MVVSDISRNAKGEVISTRKTSATAELTKFAYRFVIRFPQARVQSK